MQPADTRVPQSSKGDPLWEIATLFAPMRIRMSSGRFREPDVVFMRDEHADRRHQQFWDGADLVMEVVSEDDPDRDLVTKRVEYAAAGIPEYWIVDPRDQSVTVLTLHQLNDQPNRYEESGKYQTGEVVRSATCDGFRVDIDQIFRRQ